MPQDALSGFRVYLLFSDEHRCQRVTESVKSRAARVPGINQAVFHEQGTEMVFHELTPTDWPNSVELERTEHPISASRVAGLTLPLTQELGHPLTDFNRLAGFFGLAFASLTIAPSPIHKNPHGVPVNVSPLKSKALTRTHSRRSS